MVPFSLMVLSAELQQLVNPELSMKSFDMLYHLLGHCRTQIQRLAQAGPSPALGYVRDKVFLGQLIYHPWQEARFGSASSKIAKENAQRGKATCSQS